MTPLGHNTRSLNEQALFIRPQEAAKLLAFSERSLWARTQAGDIPCIRIGRSVRYCLEDLAAWIATTRAANPKRD